MPTRTKTLTKVSASLCLGRNALKGRRNFRASTRTVETSHFWGVFRFLKVLMARFCCVNRSLWTFLTCFPESELGKSTPWIGRRTLEKCSHPVTVTSGMPTFGTLLFTSVYHIMTCKSSTQTLCRCLRLLGGYGQKQAMPGLPISSYVLYSPATGP